MLSINDEGGGDSVSEVMAYRRDPYHEYHDQGDPESGGATLCCCPCPAARPAAGASSRFHSSAEIVSPHARPRRMWLRIAGMFLAVVLFAAACAAALAPSIERRFARGIIPSVQVELGGMRLGASVCEAQRELESPHQCGNETLVVVANYTVDHRKTRSIPGLFRATATLQKLDGTLWFEGTAIAEASFPLLKLDARDESTAVADAVFPVRVTDAAGFQRATRALFSSRNPVAVTITATATAVIRGRFLMPVTVTSPYRTVVTVPGADGLGSLPSLGLSMHGGDLSAARATALVRLVNGSPLGPSVRGVGFEVTAIVGSDAPGGGGVKEKVRIGTGYVPRIDLPVNGALDVEVDLTLAPGTARGAGQVMRAFLAGEDIGVESVVRLGVVAGTTPTPPSSSSSSSSSITTFATGATTTGAVPDSLDFVADPAEPVDASLNGPLGWALDGVVIESSIRGGHGITMSATAAEVVGGSPDSIKVNVTYLIENPSGFVTGPLADVLLDVAYLGQYVGQSWVGGVVLAGGNNTFSKVISMSPTHDTTVVAEIGHRYIESEPFFLTFTGDASAAGGPMSHFFSGWHDGLLVAGSPTPLVAEIGIRSFGARLDPPAYKVEAVAVMHNPLPFALTMTGMSFSPFFNDTKGVHLGPLHLPPKNHIPMGPVSQTGISVPLAPLGNTSYGVWLARTDLHLAERLLEAFLVRNDLVLDLDQGTVRVSWLNLSIPFAYHGLKVEKMCGWPC